MGYEAVQQIKQGRIPIQWSCWKILILLRKYEPFSSSTVLVVNLQIFSSGNKTEELVYALINICLLEIVIQNIPDRGLLKYLVLDGP